MHKDSFGFVYNAEGDYYDLVVDKKIQKVVEELKALPHDVLIRYLTYWSEAIDSRKYVVESDLPHEEWYIDCCDCMNQVTFALQNIKIRLWQAVKILKGYWNFTIRSLRQVVFR